MHTVALVDRCEYLRTTLTILLEAHGFRVVGFATGKEMLEQYEPREGCVLMDVFLRYLDGFEVLELFKKRWHVPVILMDSVPSEEHRQRALELGAYEYLPKPWETKALIALLKQAREEDVPTSADRSPRDRVPQLE